MWDFRKKMPKTEYHQNIVEANKSPFLRFMEDFIYKNIEESYVDIFGKDLFKKWLIWKTEYGLSENQYNNINESTLILKLLHELKIPEDEIKKKPRTKYGIVRRFNIQALKKRFHIQIESDDNPPLQFLESDED